MMSSPSDMAALQTIELMPDTDILRTVEQTSLKSTHLIEEGSRELFACYADALLDLSLQEKNDLPLFQYKALEYLKKRLTTFSTEIWPGIYSSGLVDIKEKYLVPLYYPSLI
ncbi:MAG: hypothetical protein LVR00_07740 [Rhabdochlamydiaceae bacterium]